MEELMRARCAPPSRQMVVFPRPLNADLFSEIEGELSYEDVGDIFAD
jgi:hypothetical protein